MFDPTNAFIDCPKCDSARHVERVKGEQWHCNCCSHSFAVPLPALEAGSPAGRVARREAHQPTAALQFITAALLVALLPALGNAQTRYTMDPGSVPPAPVDGRAPGVVVTKARDGQPLCNGAAYEGNWDGVVAWNHPQSFTGSMIPVQTSGRYFLRATFRLDADVDRVDGAKLLRVGYPGGVTFELFDRTNTIKGQVGEVVYWGGVPVTRGCHKIEVAIAPTGVRAWLDDRELRTWTGNSNATNEIYLMSNWSSNPGWEHDANNHVYWDDVETYSDAAGHDAAAMWAGTIGEGGTPPAPVDCAGTWGAWSRVAGSESACSANGTRTFSESRLFTVSRPASHGGAACPASPESRSVTENCTPPVQSVTYTCWVTGTPTSYADGDVRRTVRCDTNGPVTSLPAGTTFTVSVPRK